MLLSSAVFLLTRAFTAFRIACNTLCSVEVRGGERINTSDMWYHHSNLQRMWYHSLYGGVKAMPKITRPNRSGALGSALAECL